MFFKKAIFFWVASSEWALWAQMAQCVNVKGLNQNKFLFND